MFKKKLTDDLTLAERQAKKKRATQGKPAENTVLGYLTKLKNTTPTFDFDRMPDSRSAGGLIASQVADFTAVYRGKAYAIEVKSTKHDHRLSLSTFPQYPRMLRRAMAGAICLLVVHHSTTKLWRIINILDLPSDVRSFDLSGYPTLKTLEIFK